MRFAIRLSIILLTAQVVGSLSRRRSRKGRLDDTASAGAAG